MANLIIDNGVNARKAHGGFPDFAVTPTLNTMFVSGSASSPTTFKDANLNNFTSATTRVTNNMLTTVPLGGLLIGAGKPSFSSDNTGIITVDSQGNVTYVSAGTANITIAVPGLGKKKYSVTAQQLGGQTSVVFNGFVTGSLGKHIVDGVNAAISGKTPPDLSGTPPFVWNSVMNLFQINGSTRNTSCWIGSSVDTSCIPQFTQSGLYGGCLISPRDMVVASHYFGWPFGVILTGSDGVSVSKLVVSARSLSFNTLLSTDITVLTFASDVPNTITPIKMLPANFRTYLPQMKYGVPCVASNQDRVLTLMAARNDGSDVGFFNTISKPLDTTQAGFYYQTRGGDSGSPVFMLINGKLVFVTHWTGIGEGAVYADNISQINAAMAANGSPYSVSTVDLSAFNTY